MEGFESPRKPFEKERIAGERKKKGKSFHFLFRIETFQWVATTPGRFFLSSSRARTKNVCDLRLHGQ
jgi:hypothetical protein